jgi:hypothetical protein
MLQRLRAALKRNFSDQPASRQLRPNELRLDVIREERLRRESRRVELATSRPQLSVEEQRTRRAEASSAVPMPTREVPLCLSALKTRSGLRQAWLLKEILGPPMALRHPQTSDNDL